MKFTGTSLSWITVKSPNYGIAQVTLDGDAPVTVDLYSPDTKWQQKVWSATGLPDSAHTLTIAYTGEQEPRCRRGLHRGGRLRRGGTLTQAGRPPPPPASTLTRYRADRHPPGSCTGSWGTGSNSGASGSSWGYANTSGSLVTVKFTGTSFGWITVKSPNYGIAQVTLDGGAPVTVDLYSPDTKWQQKVWSATGLRDSAHTVTIAYTGTKNPAAAGAYIGVDAFDVEGTLTPSIPTLTRYQQTDTRLAFTGSWGTGLNPGASGGSWGYANTSGSLVTVKFTGTSFSWITVKSPNYGIAQVTLDSDAPVTVDLYSPDTKWQQKVWSATGLQDSAHTLTIAYTGTKNPAAAGAYIGVDAFDISGILK